MLLHPGLIPPAHVPTDMTQAQSPPNSSLGTVLRSSPGDRDGQTLSLSRAWWGGGDHLPRLSMHPSFFRTPEICTAKHQTGWWVCSAGEQTLPTCQGQGGEEHHVTTSSRCPRAHWELLGRHEAVLVGTQSSGESLRLEMGVSSPNGCQVAFLAARPELWTNSLGTCMKLCNGLAIQGEKRLWGQ